MKTNETTNKSDKPICNLTVAQQIRKVRKSTRAKQVIVILPLHGKCEHCKILHERRIITP